MRHYAAAPANVVIPAHLATGRESLLVEDTKDPRGNRHYAYASDLEQGRRDRCGKAIDPS
jgi:hypothetical protein